MNSEVKATPPPAVAGQARTAKRAMFYSLWVLLGSLAFATFWPALKFGFVNFDDPIYVSDNFWVLKGLNRETVRWAFTNLEAGFWFPLTWLSYLAEVEWFKDNIAQRMHFTNLLLHSMNTVLLFVLLSRLTGAPWRSALVAALFAVHPLHVEPVVWISSRKDVLSTFFGLLSLICYAVYAQRVPALNSQRSTLNLGCSYWLALVFFVFGLMSKTMVVTLPVLMLLLDYWPLNRLSGFDFRISAWPALLRRHAPLLFEKLPFLALGLGGVLITYIAEHKVGAISTVGAVGIGARIGNAICSLAYYLWQTVWPMNLSVFYPHPKTILWGSTLLAGALLLAISAIALLEVRRRPYLLVGWLWYLVSLVPVSGLVLVGSHSHADRYTYVPLIGVSIMVVWVVADWLATRDSRPWMAAGVLSAIAVLAASGLLSRDQLRHWQDNESLFRRSLAITKNNRVAHNLLGVTLYQQDHLDEAELHWRQAISIEPFDAEAHNNLGILTQKRGDLAQAESHFRRALELEPLNSSFMNNLGQLLAARGNHAEAVVCYDAALRRNPQRADVEYNFGISLAELGRFEQAGDHYTNAIRLDAKLAFRIHRSFGVALLRHARPADALIQLQAAAAFNSEDADIQNELGSAYFALGQYEEAIGFYRRALELRPAFADAYSNLGLVLSNLGEEPAAMACFERALGVDPHHGLAHEHLGDSHRLAGRLAEAKRHYMAALATNKDNAEANYQLGLILLNEGDRAEGISHLKAAVGLRPDWIPALNSLAWVLATDSDSAQRDGGEAIDLGERASRLSASANPAVLDTLAAAYAENGRFDAAVDTAQKAARMAVSIGDNKLANAIRTRLEMYKANQPYRE